MSIGFRGQLKAMIPKGFWPYFRFVDKYLIALLYVFFATKRFVFRCVIKKHTLELQSIRCVLSGVDMGAYPGNSLESCIMQAGIRYKSGRHSIYIEYADDISRINPSLQARYPFPIGLKLIKSLELSPDKTPYYTSNKLAPASTWFSMVAVGSMLEQAVVSNLLHEQGAAPRVYDIIRLKSENNNWRYAYVVQPIKGSVVTGRTGEQFITHFKSVLTDLGMETISIKEHCDLRPPDFRHNIRRDSTGMYYVDIQNFVLSTNFNAAKVLEIEEERNEIQPYQVTVKEEEFAISLKTFFSMCGLKIATLNVVDFGLLDEKLSLSTLAGGVLWCTLVKPATVVLSIRKYLFYHGFTRFDVHDLESQRPIWKSSFKQDSPLVVMVDESQVENVLSQETSHSLSYLLVVHSNSGENPDSFVETCKNDLAVNVKKSAYVTTINKDICKISFLDIKK